MRARSLILGLAAVGLLGTLSSPDVVPRAGATFSDATTNGGNTWESAASFPRNWVAVDVGVSHACGVDIAGRPWCWGAHANGANGGTGDRLTPVEITGGFPTGTTFVDIGAGTSHSCALTDAGAAWCWGANWNGQLGSTVNLGTTTTTPQPVVTTSMTPPLTAITLGQEHTCATPDDDTLWCWGLGARGQLGNGGTNNANEPAPVTDLGATVTDVSAGAEHTCAASTSSSNHPRAWCWGRQADGRLGNGTITTGSVLSPTLVSTSTTTMPGAIASVTAGAGHSCALQATGKAWCWGLGESGRLGNGGTASSGVPQAVVTSPSGLTYDDIDAGFTGSCAFEATGRPWCWGRAAEGQAGDGPASTTPQSPTDTSARLTPVAVTTTNMSDPVSRITGGDLVTCALTPGDVWCWGRNDHGRLGSGTLWAIYDNPLVIPD
jgi:alpha-tubulin suppressor-like RCC1 family protein